MGLVVKYLYKIYKYLVLIEFPSPTLGLIVKWNDTEPKGTEKFPVSVPNFGANSQIGRLKNNSVFVVEVSVPNFGANS